MRRWLDRQLVLEHVDACTAGGCGEERFQPAAPATKLLPGVVDPYSRDYDDAGCSEKIRQQVGGKLDALNPFFGDRIFFDAVDGNEGAWMMDCHDWLQNLFGDFLDPDAKDEDPRESIEANVVVFWGC